MKQASLKNKLVSVILLICFISHIGLFAQNTQRNGSPLPEITIQGAVPQKKIDTLKYALGMRLLALEKLLLTRIVLQNYLYTFQNEKYEKAATLPEHLLLSLNTPTLQSLLPLVVELENGGEKLPQKERENFIERSIKTAWEVFQYDLAIKKQDSDERYILKEKLTQYNQEPCLLTEIVGKNVYDGSYTVSKCQDGYKNYEDHPEMKSFEKNLDQLIQNRKFTLDTFQLLATPFYSFPYVEADHFLYGQVLAKAFNLPTYYFRYCPPRNLRGRYYQSFYFYDKLSVKTALEPVSLARVKEAWIVGLKEALKMNSESLENLLQPHLNKMHFYEREIDQVLSDLAFLAKNNSLKEEMIQRLNGVSSLYVKMLNQELVQIYEANEESYQTRMLVIIGVTIATTLILGPSSWIVAAVILTSVTTSFVLSYLRYSQRSDELETIMALYYTHENVPLIDDKEFEDAISMQEGAFQDFVISGLALGLEPIFFVRLLSGVKALKGGGWVISKPHLRNLIIRDTPKGKWLPRLERAVLRSDKFYLSRLNWKTIGAAITLWLLIDSNPTSSSPSLDLDPAKKQVFLDKAREALKILKLYDTQNNSQIFTIYDESFISIHDAPFTTAQEGKFYIPYEIISSGTAQNIVYEVASTLYKTFFFHLLKEKNPYENSPRENIESEAHEFATQCGGLPF